MSLCPRRILALASAAALSGCLVHADRALLRQRAAAIHDPTSVLGLAHPGAEGNAADAAAIAVEADLDRYLRFALLRNAGLAAEYERFLAAAERVPQVSSPPDPMLTFTQFVEEVQTRTGPQERRWALTQAFPWFGELGARGDVAKGELEEQWQRVVQKRLAVERDVAVAYAEYGYLAQAIRITRTFVALLEQLEPVVQRRVAAGISSQADLLRLQVEIGRVENDLASHERVRPSLSARLAAAMNWRDDALLPLPELVEPARATSEVEATLQRALAGNPELEELRQRVRTARDRVRVAGYDRWPDLSVGVDYIETDAAVAPVPGSGDDPWALRVGFSLPLWRAKYAASEREAEARVRAAMAALADREVSLRAELEAAAFALDDADRQVVLFRDSLLPRAREALTVTRIAYTGGSASLLDMIDSERALLQFEIAYWRACRDHHRARARLEALAGGRALPGREPTNGGTAR